MSIGEEKELLMPGTLTPREELQSRWERCRDLLRQHCPSCGGILVFSRMNIYYLSGSFANGLLWLPLEGDPVLLCRRGRARARIESPLSAVSFSSYRDIENVLGDLGQRLPKTIAAEMNGLSWALSNSLTKHLPTHDFVPGDKVIALTRARKSPWELDLLRQAGAAHARCLTELLPRYLRDGISEWEIAHRISEIFFSQGHQGILRMENYGEEVFLGHIAAGESANYPSVFNGPVGLRGVHPAVPHMGSSEVRWTKGTPLTIDNGFMLAGYQTDKTQVYWLGSETSIPGPVRDAHRFCVDLQNRIAGQLRPGTLPRDLWTQSLAAAAQSPWAEGFMGLDGNKVHFVGHGIGLAVDEYPVLAQGFDLPLEEGMVIAVEPKIGLRGIGMVGLENTFEVTPHGGACLTGYDYGICCISAGD